MAGHGWKLLEVPGMAVNGLIWLEMSWNVKNAGNGLTWLEWLDIAGNGLKLADIGKNQMGWHYQCFDCVLFNSKTSAKKLVRTKLTNLITALRRKRLDLQRYLTQNPSRTVAQCRRHMAPPVIHKAWPHKTQIKPTRFDEFASLQFLKIILQNCPDCGCQKDY